MKRSSQNVKGSQTTSITGILLSWVLSTAGVYCHLSTEGIFPLFPLAYLLSYSMCHEKLKKS